MPNRVKSKYIPKWDKIDIDKLFIFSTTAICNLTLERSDSDLVDALPDIDNQYIKFMPDQKFDIQNPSDDGPNDGGFQLLDLIITELKSHMTCNNSISFIGWNHSIQTGEQIL